MRTKIFIWLVLMVVVSCSSNVKNGEDERVGNAKYKRDVSVEGNRLYEKKYKKWKCQDLEPVHSKTKSRLGKVLEESGAGKELQEINFERKRKLDIRLSALDMAMDTCEDDAPLPKDNGEKPTINNENTININNSN